MPVSYNFFTTTQKEPSLRLEEIVRRHASSLYRKPISPHQLLALDLVKKYIGQQEKPIIIDSGCGTALSTALLAKKFPEHWVIGFDKSEARLSRICGPLPPNCLVVRADLIDMWRLLYEQKWPITHHFLFFPNPWPKATQIKRRFHAHPVFSTMSQLAPYFELRSNWKIYADECAQALKILGHSTSLEEKSDRSYMTLFEKKYLESNCPIYIVKSIRQAQDTNY